MKTKTCSICKETKSLDEFHRDKRVPDGLRSECKKCFTVRQVAYKKRPGVTEGIREYHKKWSKNPKQRKKKAKYHKKWRKENSFDNDSYISRLITIKSPWIEKVDVTKEMLELKRKHLKIHRALRKMRRNQ